MNQLKQMHRERHLLGMKKEITVNTTYNTKQKILFMAITLVSSMLLLGPNACQKTQTEAGITAQIVNRMIENQPTQNQGE